MNYNLLYLIIGVFASYQEFNVELGSIKSIFQFNNVSHISLIKKQEQDFCWVKLENIEVQHFDYILFPNNLEETKQLIQIQYDSDNQQLLILTKDGILQYFSLDNLSQKKIEHVLTLNLTLYLKQNNVIPLSILSEQWISNLESYFKSNIAKMKDNIIVFVSSQVSIFQITNDKPLLLVNWNLTNQQSIVDFQIFKINDNQYYLYLLDKYTGITIISFQLKSSGWIIRNLISQINQQIAHSIICKNAYTCYAVFSSNNYYVYEFYFNFYDNTYHQVEIFTHIHPIINIIDGGNYLFILSKFIHHILLYRSNTIYPLRINGLQNLIPFNDSLIIGITKTKVFQIRMSISNSEIFCNCDNINECPSKYDYSLQYINDFNKLVNIYFSVFFITNIETQIEKAMIIIFIIIIILGVFLLILWNKGLSNQLNLLEEQINIGNSKLKKKKTPIIHTLENGVFSFRSFETSSKQIQSETQEEF